ncbi:SGNH/GDSL hydrolase family protein [Gemmata sp. JC717]|uniref:SGNH/GDSL hydrolase family protein n=1 Tax=Gemmata algarum TaxID=2975278 RepID=UPI0021BA7A7D|nr:SGNH/GDSL hydrolase family protein [Gemmata algarum]MDY3556663.1 SGNH/GDSL hydrolase family protein [Gemmata algarum]
MPRPTPDLMAIGDSLPQGCRSLSVTAAKCAQSWPARWAAAQTWRFDTPDFPRPVLFDLDQEILSKLDLVDLVRNHRIPGFLGRLAENVKDWVKNDPTSAFDGFDNVAVAGTRVIDLYKQTASTAQTVIDQRTTGSISDLIKNNGVADLHVAINARFTLNPSQNPAFANFTQMDWVRERRPKNLVVQAGHNHGLYETGNNAKLPSGGVTGATDGVSFFDQWRELARQLAELPREVERIVVCLLPKLSTVANLRPKGEERRDGYAPSYEAVFSIAPDTMDGTELAAVDKSIRDANTEIEEIVKAAAQKTGTEGRVTFFSVYRQLEDFDFKNTGDPARRLPVPNHPTVDNNYLDRTFFRQDLVKGGLQSADGLHPTAVGYALLASRLIEHLGVQPDRNVDLAQAFDDDILLTTRSGRLDALVGLLRLIRRSRVDLGHELLRGGAQDEMGVSDIVHMAQATFQRS